MKHPKFDFEMKSYWDTFEGFYQMGAQKHRIYLLDLLSDSNVSSVLDVGCGTGPVYQMIKEDQAFSLNPKWNFKYKGTDYSRGMIEICQQAFPEGNFEVEDARALQEDDRSWDCVLLLHSLDHLNDYKAAIKEATRVAKKYVCIVLWRSFVAEGTHLNDRNMYGKQEGDQPWEDTYLQEYSRQALEDEFTANGLIIDHVAEGETINSDNSHYNFLYLLKKNDV